jgi:hypothetical protein
MKKLGIAYWKMDAESFEYPVRRNRAGQDAVD